jgi:hypothetical protein
VVVDLWEVACLETCVQESKVGRIVQLGRHVVLDLGRFVGAPNGWV